MSYKLSVCDKNDISSAISIINNEFVYSRNRNIAVQERYLGIFDNLCNVFVIKDCDNVIATIVKKDISIFQDNCQFSGVLLGMICVLPEYRNKNIMSCAILELEKMLDVDFIMLFAKNPRMYSKIGYTYCDNGEIFGLVSKSNRNIECKANVIEWPSERVNKYYNTPLPFDKVRVFEDTGKFAIVGEYENRACICSVDSDDVYKYLLWYYRDVDLYINGVDCDAAKCINTNCNVKLTMWKKSKNIKPFYIPFIERI